MDTCPNCGYCPHCKRSNGIPVVPTPVQPDITVTPWTQPWIVPCTPWQPLIYPQITW